jgi:hypothetical protein
MSMTGGGGSPKKNTLGKWYSPQMPAGATQMVKLNGMQSMFGGGLGEVSGFSAATIEYHVVADLPTNVFVPADALTAIYAAKRLDLWIETGRRVQDWAQQQGITDVSWLDDDTEGLRLPPGISPDDAPAFVTQWLADSADMEAIIADLVIEP